jgi:hypothetical protein
VLASAASLCGEVLAVVEDAERLRGAEGGAHAAEVLAAVEERARRWRGDELLGLTRYSWWRRSAGPMKLNGSEGGVGGERWEDETVASLLSSSETLADCPDDGQGDRQLAGVDLREVSAAVAELEARLRSGQP